MPSARAGAAPPDGLAAQHLHAGDFVVPGGREERPVTPGQPHDAAHERRIRGTQPVAVSADAANEPCKPNLGHEQGGHQHHGRRKYCAVPARPAGTEQHECGGEQAEAVHCGTARPGA